MSDDFMEQCRITYAYLRQGKTWFPKDRPPLDVADMDLRWRRNAARWLEKRAAIFEIRYTLGEVAWLATPTLREVERGPMLAQLDLMSDNVADAMDQWQAEREADPVAWIRSTVLYQALVTAPCCGGTGYADYAAVPCPAADCPIPGPAAVPA